MTIWAVSERRRDEAAPLSGDFGQRANAAVALVQLASVPVGAATSVIGVGCAPAAVGVRVAGVPSAILVGVRNSGAIRVSRDDAAAAVRHFYANERKLKPTIR